VQLTKEDVLAAAKKHLRPDRLKIVAVGSGEALPQALATFGDVKEITLSPEG
jgi:predicted Zn-dependent peptidase